MRRRRSLGLCLPRALVHHVLAIILLWSRGGSLRKAQVMRDLSTLNDVAPALCGWSSFKLLRQPPNRFKPLEMASDTVSRIYACLHALGMLRSYQEGNRCAIWTCAIQKQISRHVGHSMHGCISMPSEHCPHCEHVQVFRYGAFQVCSDSRLESMNKKYKEGLSLEKVPLSTPSPSLARPTRLIHATRQAVGQPSGAPLRRGVHRSPSPEKFAAPAAGKVRFCENNGA